MSRAAAPARVTGNEAAPLFWPGWAVAVGALGVLLTSVLYAVSPPRAALPMPNPLFSAALLDMLAGRATLAAAGTVGVVSDVIFAAGALVMLAYGSASRSRLAPLGWAGIALSNLIFIAVDGLAAGVLPRVAALEGGAAVFAGLKLAYDMAFIVGTMALGWAGWRC